MYSEERPGSLRAPSQFKYEIVRYSCNRIPIPLHLLNFNLHSSTLHLHTSFLNGWVKFTHFKVEGHSCMRACMQLELARIFSQHSSSHIKNKRLLLKNTLIMRPGLTYPLPVAHLNAQKASSHNTPSVSSSQYLHTHKPDFPSFCKFVCVCVCITHGQTRLVQGGGPAG
jgi:hypothetical protein